MSSAAARASGPIRPTRIAAVTFTWGFAPLRNFRNGSTAAFASGPIRPSATAAAMRVPISGSFNRAISGSMAAACSDLPHGEGGRSADAGLLVAEQTHQRAGRFLGVRPDAAEGRHRAGPHGRIPVAQGGGQRLDRILADGRQRQDDRIEDVSSWSARTAISGPMAPLARGPIQARALAASRRAAAPSSFSCAIPRSERLAVVNRLFFVRRGYRRRAQSEAMRGRTTAISGFAWRHPAKTSSPRRPLTYSGLPWMRFKASWAASWTQGSRSLPASRTAESPPPRRVRWHPATGRRPRGRRRLGL